MRDLCLGPRREIMPTRPSIGVQPAVQLTPVRGDSSRPGRWPPGSGSDLGGGRYNLQPMGKRAARYYVWCRIGDIKLRKSPISCSGPTGCQDVGHQPRSTAATRPRRRSTRTRTAASQAGLNRLTKSAAAYAPLAGWVPPILIRSAKNSRKTRIRIGRSPPCPR
jgi:hypothetical protein